MATSLSDLDPPIPYFFRQMVRQLGGLPVLTGSLSTVGEAATLGERHRCERSARGESLNFHPPPLASSHRYVLYTCVMYESTGSYVEVSLTATAKLIRVAAGMATGPVMAHNEVEGPDEGQREGEGRGYAPAVASAAGQGACPRVRAETPPGADLRPGLPIAEHRPDLRDACSAWSGTGSSRSQDVVQTARPNKRVYELTPGRP